MEYVDGTRYSKDKSLSPLCLYNGMEFSGALNGGKTGYKISCYKLDKHPVKNVNSVK